MKYRLLDILCCPYCKDDGGFPLRLIVFSEKRYERGYPFCRRPACELYCGLRLMWIREIGEEVDCEGCIKREVDEGMLICPKCGRWFPIIEEIPSMLPDNLRNRSEDLKFLRKYVDRIPRDILEEGKPFSLKGFQQSE